LSTGRIAAWYTRSLTEALASYAKRADDDTLRGMADRIQAPVIWRCGVATTRRSRRTKAWYRRERGPRR
jgi:hypothetical protein